MPTEKKYEFYAFDDVEFVVYTRNVIVSSVLLQVRVQYVKHAGDQSVQKTNTDTKR